VTKTIDPNSKIGTPTKNENATLAQQTPENPNLEFNVFFVLLFDDTSRELADKLLS